MNKNKNAITIVELIIVVSILTILGIVGFIAYQSYLVTVRDSTRLVELENMGSSLGSYVLVSGFYPEPTDGQSITYSGEVVWNQGVFGNEVANIVGYSDDVIDPLTKSKYTYSVKNTRKEYSIAGVLEERPGLVYNDSFINSANAIKIGETKGTAVVKGNYNGEVLSIMLNGATNVLALPSIISTDLSNTDLQYILDNNKLVYNDFNNLPASYTGTVYKLDENTDFSANNLIVYSGSISELKHAYNQVGLLQQVRLAYSGSVLGKKISVNRVDDTDLFSPEPSSKIKVLACDLINFKLKYFVECGGIDFITFFVVNVLHIDISNLPGTKITTVYQDASGNFVFGTNQGLAFYDGTNWLVYDQHDSDLVHNYITSVNQDNNGDYWIGTQNGINKLVMGDYLNKADDIWFTYTKSILFNSHIQYIYTDTDGVVWIGTNMGVTSYNGEVWTDYTRQSGDITHNNITAIYHDSQGHVWFGTNSKGVDKYTLSNGDLKNYNAGKLPDQRVTYIFETASGSMWIATQGGLGMTPDFGTTWQSFTNASTSGGLAANNITYLYEDSSGNIWVGTVNGLSKYNGSTWTKYNTTTSPNPPNYLLGNFIFLIYEDEFGNIIVFSDGGMDTINSAGDIITYQ